ELIERTKANNLHNAFMAITDQNSDDSI
ncbi:uncharacterized protein METZ01_LOCUS481405, partial [marine metagenome]